MDVRIRAAVPDDEERLREIAIASKAYWGYDQERVREWGAGLDFSAAGELYVAEAEGRVVAFAAVVGRGEVCELDHLWIEPAWIARGVGTRLFEFAADRAKRLGALWLEWEAEPNAIGFYEKMGGRYVRDSPPTQWGRILPVMGLELRTG